MTANILKILGKPSDLVKLVEDRKGHDLRYSVDYTKIQTDLGWEPQIDFESGLKATIAWYQENRKWWEDVKSGEYQKFYELNYANRIS